MGNTHFARHRPQPPHRGRISRSLVHKKVTFFKHPGPRPGDYEDLAAEERFCVGVLTAAAENVSGSGRSVGPNAQRFIDFLLDVVHMQGEECTHIILSAWGCGAYGQSAEAVARCFKHGLSRFDARTYPRVTFAIIDDHNSPPPGNLHAFRAVFDEQDLDHFDSSRSASTAASSNEVTT